MALVTESVQCFGRKKTAVAVTHCKRGRGLIKINGVPIELVQPEILRYKAFEPILLLGRHRFAGVDMRIRVKGGGHTSQNYAIRQSIAKAVGTNVFCEKIEKLKKFEQLAEATEGYFGSNLKNLCVAAAYRPVQELLDKESKGEKCNEVPAMRPLNVDDFIHSKAKAGSSVAYNATSIIELREWNEQYGEGGSKRKSPFGF